jgi:hypothetical protein
MNKGNMFYVLVPSIAVAISLLAGLTARAAEAEKSLPDPTLRGTIGRGGHTPATDNGVESFFQLTPVQPSKAHQNVPSDSVAAKSIVTNEKKPVMKEVGRALWHVLDNAGVPMVLSKQNDLDPSIDTSHWMPPALVPDLKRVDKPVENPKQTVIEGTAQIDNGAIHKIPQSELEGVELPTLHDAQAATH